MGKFAIALCFLLAACGAQAAGGIAAVIFEQVISAITASTTIAQEEMVKLEPLLDEGIKRANALADIITTDFETAMNTYNENIAPYFEGADTVHLEKCIELSRTFRETATERANQMKDCFTKNLSTMQSSYHQTLTSFQEILVDMKKLEEDAKVCVDSSTSTLIGMICITKVSAEMTGSIAEDMENLVTNSTSIIEGFSNIDEMVATCSAASAISSINLEAVDSAVQVAECAAQMAMGSVPSDISDLIDIDRDIKLIQ